MIRDPVRRAQERARRLGLSGAGRIWLLTAALLIAGGTLLYAVVLPLPDASPPFRIEWWALAILFYLAETNVVHLEFRREAHSFSLSEIPLVLGLVFCTPQDFVMANLVGAAIALTFHRHQPPIKLAFNLSHFLLEATIAAAIFGIIVGPATTLGPALWLGTFVAAGAVNVIGIFAIAFAISLAEGRWQGDRLSQVLSFGLGVGMTNTSLALIGVTLLWVAPSAAWLLAIPVVLLFLAYRAYMDEREKHQSLEFLYESSRILQRSPELERAIVDLLEHARKMFRAESARLTLFPTAVGDQALTTRIGPADTLDIMRPEPYDPDEPLYRHALVERGAYLYVRPANPLGGQAPEDSIRDAMVIRLRGERRILGLLVVANRLGNVSSFDTEDLRLFETLANHAAIALENGQLGESVTQLSALKEQLRYQAYHDPLTGLGNRSLFVEQVQEALLAAAPGATAPVVLFIDLDDFKTVNDSLGHAAGDELLRAVAVRLDNCLRPDDLAVRLGGDEFAVLVRQGDIRTAKRIAERVIESVESPYRLGGTDVSIAASIGIAGPRRTGETADALLRNADVAMYTAKAGGKGRYAVFEPTMHAAVVRRHALQAELRHAVADGEFTIHYQPIARLSDGQVQGFEALVRWAHPTRGLVGPTDFIPLAEETGLILPIGRWVLEQACRQGRIWHDLFPASKLTMSVNLSPQQLQQADFVEDVAEILRSTGLDARSLILEITETLMMQDLDTTLPRLRALKGLGVGLAIDDFGTGWSSMSVLRELPVDCLKIPKTFLERTGESDDQWEFARAIVALGHSLKLKIVAEGIEQPEQLARLREMGCDSGQGFFFAVPMESVTAGTMLEDAPIPDMVPVKRAVPGAAWAGVPLQP